jgi:hypothetical protein
MEPANDLGPTAGVVCSFCNKTAEQARHLVQAATAAICDECVKLSLEAIRQRGPKSTPVHVFELLRDHFAGFTPDQIVTSSRVYSVSLRVDVQLTFQEFIARSARQCVGVRSRYAETITVASLMEPGQYAAQVGPVSHEDIDLGDGDLAKCITSALATAEVEGEPVALLLSREAAAGCGFQGVRVEVAMPSADDAAARMNALLDLFESAVRRAQSYRGKVLSLKPADYYSGAATGVAVHRLRNVDRDDVVLPPSTLRLLERNIIEFAAARPRLRALGLPLKKGVLFFGPPGTGKTHTVHYLARHLPDHTTLLVTAEQVALLDEYFAMARLMQPAVLVIEDADLIARDRTSMQSPVEEVLLNKLLNEMDGLREDCEVFFILTTNRPEMLEAALASRPGRIDQAIEFPLPDTDGRRTLIRLYAKGLEISATDVEWLVERTNGVSASFIKELLRRAAQYAAGTAAQPALDKAGLSDALDELITSAGRFNLRLLGTSEDAFAADSQVRE